jgi:transcriptional regulator with PAS, ATPase and Fis domain
MMEAELFGYEKGAFTDAKTTKKGLFEAADGGTLFLDEIGYLNLDMQVKLLKIIEDKKLRRLGSLVDRTIDVHIISATNRDLEEAVEQGEFREDLFYRLKVITLDLPPLRERGDDLLLIARYFLTLYARQYGKPVKSFSEQAKEVLAGYHWPGNIRELQHVIERATIWEEREQMGVDNLFIKAAPPPEKELSLHYSKEHRITIDFPREGINLDRVEKEIIRKALEQTTWNLSKAAKFLGITRDTLRYRMSKYQLSPQKNG